MYINYIIKLKRYIRKEGRKLKERVYIIDLIA